MHPQQPERKKKKAGTRSYLLKRAKQGERSAERVMDGDEMCGRWYGRWYGTQYPKLGVSGYLMYIYGRYHVGSDAEDVGLLESGERDRGLRTEDSGGRR